MHRRHARTSANARDASAIPQQRQRYSVKPGAQRTDLTCASCQTVIAYGVRAERVLADAEFFLEAHKPFCAAAAVRV
jgi:hypothetical protein